MRHNSTQIAPAFMVSIGLSFPSISLPMFKYHTRIITSEANRLQSSVLDTWNTTFGILPGGSEWQAAFPRALFQSLSAMTGRADVKMPPGMVLIHEDHTARSGTAKKTATCFNEDGRGRLDGGERVREASKALPEEEGSCPQSLMGDALGDVPSVGYGRSVAGMLHATSADVRGSFIRSGRG